MRTIETLHDAHPRRRLLRLSPLLLAMTISGCMVGPDYTRPKLSLPDHYQQDSALDAQAKQANLNDWWKGFHDTRLDSIVEQTTRQNLSIQAAEARIVRARAMVRESRAHLYPEGSLDGSVARQRQSLLSPEGQLASPLPGYTRDQTLQQIDVGATWETDLAGGLHRRARAYLDEAQAAEADRLEVRISVVAEAADAYFRIREAQDNERLLQAQVDTDRRLLELTGAQVAAGVVTDRTMDDAKAVLETDLAAMDGLHDQLQQQDFRLDVLMGDVPGTDRFGLRAPIETSWSVPGIPASIRPTELMRRRPDVIAAERRLAAQTENIGIAMSQYYPSLSLGGLLGFEQLGAGNLFESAAFQPALLAGIHWRLFDFGKVDAEVAASHGGQAEALADYRQTVLRATEDVERALSSLAAVDAQERRTQRVIDAHTRSMASIQRSFRAGASSMVDVLQRKRALLFVERTDASLRAAHARATVEVFRTLGGGWSPDDTPSVASRSSP